jgi:hypothetical protein
VWRDSGRSGREHSGQRFSGSRSFLMRRTVHISAAYRLGLLGQPA